MTDGAATIGDQLVSSLADLGCDHVFTLPSANVDPLLKCLASSQTTPVLVANEMSAGFMADGYARITGTPGAALVGGGIASLYVLPAMVNARVEGVPVLLMTGDVPEDFYKDVPFQSARHDGTRSEATFREALGPECCFKFGTALKDMPTVAKRLGAGKPVYVSVPYDVQGEPDITPRDKEPEAQSGLERDDLLTVQRVAGRLRTARHPIVVLGPRMAHVLGKDALVEQLIQRGMRVATSIGALGLVRHDADGYLGVFGYSGADTARHAILDPACDMILYLGGRPGQRDGAGWSKRLSEQPDLLARIDTLGSAPLELPTFADLAPQDFSDAIDALLVELSGDGPNAASGPSQGHRRTEHHPADLMEHCIAQTQTHFGSELVAFVDAGLHRGAAIRAWRSTGQNDFHMSAEQAPMGWAIAASIGASFGQRDTRILCITGDGCMHLLGQEIATAARYQSPVLFLVANNGGLGSISRRAQTEDEAQALADRTRVDWVAFAGTLGVQGATAQDAESMQSALEQASAATGPFLIDLRLPAETRQGKIDPRAIFLGA